MKNVAVCVAIRTDGKCCMVSRNFAASLELSIIPEKHFATSPHPEDMCESNPPEDQTHKTKAIRVGMNETIRASKIDPSRFQHI